MTNILPEPLVSVFYIDYIKLIYTIGLCNLLKYTKIPILFYFILLYFEIYFDCEQ